MDLVLATANVHKIREFREMLKPFKHVDVVSLLNFPQYNLPAETGETFKENACIKALDAAAALKKWVLADDSGLVVPSLNGRPGVYSSRYAGEDATDSENKDKLLRELNGIEDLGRSAYFECWLALASPEGNVRSFYGRTEGIIANEERGRKGFGYDSIFIKHDYDKTFAELDEGVKNRISHRRKAFDKFTLYLETIMKS
jgi:XTP/dITP diphosphohydrolase